MASRPALEAVSGNTAPNSKKRKSDDTRADAVDLDEIDLDGIAVDENCDQVRRKINRFLDSGEMGKGAFADAICVSSGALNRFLGQSGPYKGDGCDAYDRAWAYFKKREIAGLKMPTKKQKTSSTGKGGKKAAETSVDVSDVHLDGEERDAVPVYDTCDEIRRKINAYLKKPGVTQAQFCRDLCAQLHTEDQKTIQARQLASFRNGKGPRAGAKTLVFYAAYVFFEKMRIKEAKPKSKHREEMERVWAKEGGFDRTHDGRTGFFCSGDERPVEDKYGHVEFVRIR